MLQVGFELTIPVFERPEIIHILDGAASAIGALSYYILLIQRTERCDMCAVPSPTSKNRGKLRRTVANVSGVQHEAELETAVNKTRYNYWDGYQRLSH
jgi:hypothetical protein